MPPNKIVQPTIDIILDSQSINQRLLQLTMKTGYSIIQRNGQRYYGPNPNWTGPPPKRGSEVFIGRLPRDCFEDELVPLLETIGQIYELRMMLNFTGYNRGYAFVTYFNPTIAWKAVEDLNEFEIRIGKRLGVWKSMDNCRLYLGGIPTTMTKADAWEEIAKLCPTAKEIIMYPNPKDRKKNRGFMFLEFDSHRSAAMAKRDLIPGSIKLWNHQVVVDWATPEPDVNPSIMSTICKLFIRNFPASFTEESVRRLLEEVIPRASIQRVHLTGYYGFIHFDNRANAELAEEHLSRFCLDGEYLEVNWARPRCYRRMVVPTPHCRSVPARYRHACNRQQSPSRSSPTPEIPPSLPEMPPPLPEMRPSLPEIRPPLPEMHSSLPEMVAPAPQMVVPQQVVAPATQMVPMQHQMVPVSHSIPVPHPIPMPPQRYAVQLQPYNPTQLYYYPNQ